MAVPGGVVRCLEGLREYIALKNIAKFFPPWTVPGTCG